MNKQLIEQLEEVANREIESQKGQYRAVVWHECKRLGLPIEEWHKENEFLNRMIDRAMHKALPKDVARRWKAAADKLGDWEAAIEAIRKVQENG